MRYAPHRVIGLAAALVPACAANAQQSFYNTSAAQPSTGTLLLRQTIEAMQFGDDPSPLDRDILQFKFTTDLAYGLSKNLSIMARFPTLVRDTDSPVPGVSSDDFGAGDLHVMLKRRIWQRDSGPIDTMRLSLLAGLDLPTSTAPFSNRGWDPMIGAVFTSIQGRHGFNAALRYTFNTHERSGPATTVDDGLEDTLWLDTGYLYRLSPAEYDASTHGAWYAMLELNGTWETNGDRELRIAPGIMYEARNWVIEAAIQLPVYENLDHRPETDFVIGVGFRILF